VKDFSFKTGCAGFLKTKTGQLYNKRFLAWKFTLVQDFREDILRLIVQSIGEFSEASLRKITQNRWGNLNC